MIVDSENDMGLNTIAIGLSTTCTVLVSTKILI